MPELALQHDSPHAAPPHRIPTLDLRAYLAGESGAERALADRLSLACADTGFFILVAHGVERALMDAVFAQSAAFFGLDDARKLALRIGRYNIGYMPSGMQTVRTSKVAVNTRPNLNESFYITRERAPDDPDILAGTPLIGLNKWPDGLPEFRAVMLRYWAAMERLAKRLLPPLALTLDLPRDHFERGFANPACTLRLIRYQPQPATEPGAFGFAPHTDGNFLSLLAQSNVPGLEILTKEGDWIMPPAVPGAFVVNTGEILARLSNDSFTATPHRVVNRTGALRFACPFFFGPNLDYVIKPAETCVGPGNPPHYEPITYMDQRLKLVKTNFAHRQAGNVETY